MLKQCVSSPATLEVMLNSYSFIPPCEWMDSLSDQVSEVSSLQRYSVTSGSHLAHIWLTSVCFPPLIQDHQCFFDLVRQQSGQPRSLQHLCRCAVRLHLGASCNSAVNELDIPSSLRAYLLLCNDGTLLWNERYTVTSSWGDGASEILSAFSFRGH